MDDLNEGIALFQKGQNQEALAAFRRVAAGSADAARARVWEGNCLLALRDFAAAEAAYRAAVALDAALPDAWNNLGNALALQGRRDEGRAAFARALERDPGYRDALVNLATLDGVEGKLSEAEAGFRRVVADHGDDVPAVLGLARSQSQQGRIDDAIASVQAALALKPQRELRRALADFYAAAGRYGDAAGELERAVGEEPENAGLRTNLGVMLHASGKVEEGRRELARVLELAPDFAPALFNLGRLDLATGQHEPALARFRAAVAAAPARPEFHTHVINLLLNLRRLDEARDAVETGLRVLPNDPDLVSLRGVLALEMRGDAAMAETEFRRALSLSGGHLGSALNLAQLFLRQSRLGEAEALLLDIVSQVPQAVYAHVFLGQLRARKGDLKPAREAFEAALKLEPENLMALDGLVGAARGLGDTRAVIAAARAARRGGRVVDGRMFPNLAAVDVD